MLESCKTKMVPKLLKEMEAKRIQNAKKRLKTIKAKLKLDKENKGLKMGLAINQAFVRPDTKALKKQRTKFFINTFCNPGCLGTTFQEDADFDKIVDDLPDSSPTLKKKTVKLLKTARKQMLKGRKKLLGDDSFYHAFDKKTKKRLIKDGALSGCIVGLFEI